MAILKARKQKVKENILEWAKQYRGIECIYDNIYAKQLVIQKVTEKLDYDQRYLQPADQISDEVYYIQRVQNTVKQLLGHVHEPDTLQPQRVNDQGTQCNMQNSQYITSQTKDRHERLQVDQQSQKEQGNTTLWGLSAQQIIHESMIYQETLQQLIKQKPFPLQKVLELIRSQDYRLLQIIDPVLQQNITQVNKKNEISLDQRQRAGDQGLAVSGIYKQNVQDDIPQESGSQNLRCMQPQLIDDSIHKQQPFSEFCQPKQRQDLEAENINKGQGRSQNMKTPLFQGALFERQNRQNNHQTRGQVYKGIEDSALQPQINGKFYPINTVQGALITDVGVVRHSNSEQCVYNAGLSKQGDVQPEFKGTQGFNQTSKLEQTRQYSIQQNLPQKYFQYKRNIPGEQMIQLNTQQAMEVKRIEKQQTNHVQKKLFQQMQNKKQVYDNNSGKTVYQSQTQGGMQDNQGQVQTVQGTVSQFSKGNIDNIPPQVVMDYSNMQNTAQQSQPSQQIQQEKLVRFWNLHSKVKDVSKAYLQDQLEKRITFYVNAMNDDTVIRQLEKSLSMLNYIQDTSRPNLKIDLPQGQRLEAYKKANNKISTARGEVSQDSMLLPYSYKFMNFFKQGLKEKVGYGLLTEEQAIKFHKEELFRITQMCQQTQQKTDVIVTSQQQQYESMQNNMFIG